MKTRIIALAIAAVLAIVGGIALVGYVRGADQRAADGAALSTVLVVTEAVPGGTGAAQLAMLVEERDLPVSAVLEGALTSTAQLEELGGSVTTAALVPGDQLVRARFASTADVAAGGGSVAVPEGLQEVAIPLDGPRALGGRLVPGDEVGVLVSFGNVEGAPQQTNFMLEQVLVVAVSGGADGSGVVVTLAVDGGNAERIVYAREYASIWLTRQGETVPAHQGGPATGEGLVG